MTPYEAYAIASIIILGGCWLAYVISYIIDGIKDDRRT